MPVLVLSFLFFSFISAYEAPLYVHENEVANTYIVTFQNGSIISDSTGTEWQISAQDPGRASFVASLTDETLADARAACTVAFVETDALGEYEDDGFATNADGVSRRLRRRAGQEDAPW